VKEKKKVIQERGEQKSERLFINKNSSRALKTKWGKGKENRTKRKGNRAKKVNGRGKIKLRKKGNGNGGKYKKEKQDKVSLFT
jgi:hypothetical protein